MTGGNLQEQARALGDPTRYAIFQHLAGAGSPVDIAGLNGHFPLNHNAIRQHLAKLVAAGLVLESTAAGPGRGRPRLRYEIDPGAGSRWGATGPYERLSALLVEIIRSGDTPESVGRGAANLFRVAAPSGDAITDIADAMARQGFDPEVRSTRGGAEILLHRCPFASAALADRHTVCALHLGVAEGLADGSPVRVSGLVAHDPRQAGCRLRIEDRADPGDDAVPATISLRGSR
jgi:predicted ArsR family transcriptional regulator